MDLPLLASYCSTVGIELSPEQLEGFVKFRQRLYELNEVMNLTRVPFEECELRHFVDSLLISEFIEDRTHVLDVGCGPGFPSWPLACTRPRVEVTAMDSSGKMLKILREITLPNLTVFEGRAEDADFFGAFDVVTGRAVAPLSIQLEISAPFAAVGGGVIPFRTPNEIDEIERFDASRLGLQLESIEERELPGTDVVRAFPLFRKVAKTPKAYPRSWAAIKKKPL